MQTTFIGLYRGRTVAQATLVAVTSEPTIVQPVLQALTAGQPGGEREGDAPGPLRLLPDDQTK
ncbi:MAG: hypothetical protein AVDCRST_MAG93-4908 [uncultured Chloroflexia bacterium]|uniref:Uncharacterized protein n=1 Tax=uncultured Chloroflexia bacterium TaxID=1672391 RepID=A0A6J4KI83_9CHLR|nr:MAG: hypothetical protein AVDCRST_MAG93-4908 [uncultured Chloroflexia bacterium]